MNLQGRAQLLHAMGVLQPGEKTWRPGWSHDDGEYIYFDAWTNRYHEGKYPMCTELEYIRPNADGKVRHTDRRTGASTPWAFPRGGHKRWLHHLGLCIQGLRVSVLVNPEPRARGFNQGKAGALGWHPQYSLGQLFKDVHGHWWFETTETVAVDTSVDPDIQIAHWASAPDKSESASTDDGLAAARAMIERHIAESQEMLRRLANVS